MILEMPVWLSALYIVFWVVFAIFLAIGGYFMFRKFLKALPKEDGLSKLDWQEIYINQTLHLWTDEYKNLLNELVLPVPKLFRDVAKQAIAGKIGELALEQKATQLSQALIIQGYILATPRRDYKALTKRLVSLNIDPAGYKYLFKQA